MASMQKRNRHNRLARVIQRGLSVVAALAVTLSAGLPAQARTGLAAGEVVTDTARDKKHKMEVRLSATLGAAGSNEVSLAMTTTPQMDAPSLQTRWLVPAGATLAGGPDVEGISLPVKGSPISRTRTMRFAGPGVYKVMASASIEPGTDQHYGATGVLFITIAPDGMLTASDKDPDAKNPNGTEMPSTITAVPAAKTAAPSATNGDPCFTVHGRVTRVEKAPRAGPMYAPDIFVPVRNAVLEMREEDTLFDDTYGKVLTGNDGSYSFSFCDDDGIFDDTLELYVRLRANIQSLGRDVVSVEDDGIIDDVYEFKSPVTKSGGGDITINPQLTQFQSAVMNVADVVYEAWQTWNQNGGAKGDDAIFDEEAEVHYEPGDGIDNSFYSGYFLVGANVFNANDISIADDPSDPDPWDDSVIAHEWGHFADDYYGCDDNGGGPHNVDTLVSDRELSWGEGYPDYYQSAVRSTFGHPDAEFYLDVDGSGSNGISVNLETYDNTRAVGMNNPGLLSDQNELAIAAMLWDLFDNNNDPRIPDKLLDPAQGPFDRVAYGHRWIQEVYTDPTFESNGDFFDDTCTTSVYLWAWRKLGKPTDAATAEAVTKNIAKADPFSGGSLVQVLAAPSPNPSPVGTGEGSAAPSLVNSDLRGRAGVGAGTLNPNDIDTRWWRQLTMIADNSASMGADGKLDAVKTVMHEQVNDVVAPDPKGVEVRLNTFSNASNLIVPRTRGQFFPDSINPLIDGITPRAEGDFGCPVSSLDALAQSVQDQRGGQAWVYTDGDPYVQPSLPALRRMLNERQVRGSFVLLGGCGTLARKNSDVSGEEERFLQLAADGSQPGGIVPYLITALGSGGQFLFVAKDQLGNAKDILRAQLANSAGAGRWSDYVSDSFTYRWDKLTSKEYQWFPAESLGQDKGQIFDGQYLTMTLIAPFDFYSTSHTTIGVSQDGVFKFNPSPTCSPFCIKFRDDFLDVLNSDLTWNFIPYPPRLSSASDLAGLNATDQTPTEPNLPGLATASCASFVPGPGPLVKAYSAGLGFEWQIISVQGCDQDNVYRAYEVWLNYKTGEIRYEYDRLRNEAGNAEIGLRREYLTVGNSTQKLVVSNKDVNGARSGMGYKFTPAPPAPTRTYTVAVDALISSVAFLQTGYSGNFEVMKVLDPAGNPVNCADTANVLCLTLNNQPGDRMVQMVQVNVNGKAGTWRAIIDAGAKGEATFSFNALAASAIVADSPTKRLLPSKGASALKLNLGGAAAGNSITGWLQQPNGARWGSSFSLFDDGMHGDGRAGDGRFGAPDFEPPGPGVGYLWISGTVNGTAIVRSDSVPFDFQPLIVNITEDNIPNDNDVPRKQPVDIINLDSRAICVNPDVTVPDTWSYSWDIDFISCLNIPAGGSRTAFLTVYPAWYHAPSLSEAEITVAFTEDEEGGISASDSATFIRRRGAAHLEFDDVPQGAYMRPNGTDFVTMTLRVEDEEGAPVADDTLVQLSATNGTLGLTALNVAQANANAPEAAAYTQNGSIVVRLTAGTTTGEATALATLTTPTRTLTATVTIDLHAPVASRITLQATPTDLASTNTSAALLASVLDANGGPIANATVRIGEEGDGQQGLINGAEVITATTNAQGQVLATFAKVAGAKGVNGVVGVRAELLAPEGGGFKVISEARVELILSPNKKVFLPLLRKS